MPAAAAGSDLRADHIERDRRRLQYLQLLNYAWLAIGVVSLGSFPFYPYWQVSVALAAGAMLTFVAVQLLLHSQRLRAACIAFCVAVDLTFFAIFLILVALLGAEETFRTQAPVLMLMGLTTLFASALIGPQVGFIVAAINTLLVLGLRLWLASEAAPRPAIALFSWLLAGIGFLYERTLREVFQELRAIRLGLESVVLDRTEELRESIANLESTAARLRSANHDLELFSGSVAHDLREPLRTIEGYSRLLQEDVAAENPEAAHALQRMLVVESRMSRLIEGLLSFARLGHHALKPQRIDMLALATRIVAEQRERECARILQIEIGELPQCTGDLLLIEQVMANLLSNAIKFTRPRSVARIEIQGRRQNNEAIYSIKDNGVGFANDQTPRLFTTLQRLHSQNEFEGTGIGLATVKRIVERHGGRVWANGQIGVGAEFSFSMPGSIQSRAGELDNSSVSATG